MDTSTKEKGEQIMATSREPDKISRREALRLIGLGGAAALLAATTGPALAAGRRAAPVLQEKPYAGLTMRMLSQGGSDYEPGLKQYALEFEDKTGAKIEFDWAPWESLMPKVQADIASGKPQFDMFTNDIEFQYTIYPNLLPINDFIKNANYDMSGFFAPVAKYGEGIGGQPGVRYGLPIIVGVSVIFYRKDLIPTFPTTWADYEQAMAANTGNGKYGLAFAGVPAQLVKLFLARYWSQGDPLFTPDWKPLINSEKGVKALSMLKDEMTKYSPPGILAWDNPDAANAFLNGDVAIQEGWGSFILPSLQDPSKSKVVDKWAIAGYPENGTGNFVQHNMVIFKTAQNPQAAFDYIAYCTGPDNAKRNLTEFKMVAARKTPWTDPDVVAQQPYLPDLAAVLDRGKPFSPNVPQWLELFIGLAEQLSAAMAGKAEVKQALDNAAEKWTETIQQAPLSFPYTE